MNETIEISKTIDFYGVEYIYEGSVDVDFHLECDDHGTETLVINEAVINHGDIIHEDLQSLNSDFKSMLMPIFEDEINQDLKPIEEELKDMINERY